MKIEDMSPHRKRQIVVLTKWVFRITLMLVITLLMLSIMIMAAHLLPPPVNSMIVLVMVVLTPVMLVLVGYAVIRADKKTWGDYFDKDN